MKHPHFLTDKIGMLHLSHIIIKMSTQNQTDKWLEENSEHENIREALLIYEHLLY